MQQNLHLKNPSDKVHKAWQRTKFLVFNEFLMVLSHFTRGLPEGDHEMHITTVPITERGPSDSTLPNTKQSSKLKDLDI